jgi:hypothetical protein
MDCFDSINQQSDGKTKSPSCPFCLEPIRQLCPIVPLSKEQTRAMKRAEIAAQVALARQKKAEEAMMDQFVSMFAQAARSMTQDLKKMSKNPKKVPKGAMGAIVCGLRNLLKKQWSTNAEFCQEFGKTYIEYQSEFAEGPGPWQKLVGCWDFQPSHLLAIKEWCDILPKGIVFLDPCSGKGLLAACLKVFGIPVVCNDIESQDFKFVPEISIMDGIDFLNLYIATNPKTPVAIILSWAPQKGHTGEHLSETIFRFAHATKNVLAVIHISEGWIGGVQGGRIGCTDTVEALVFKEENFQTILDIPREYQPQWKHDAGMPINDHLTINVPRRA